jgi:hypothetical protein
MPEEQYRLDNKTALTEYIYRGGDGCPLYATTISPEEEPAVAVEHPVLVLLHR